MSKNNEGAIWGNTNKERSQQPDFTGTATVKGVEYKVAAWKRDPGGNPKAPSLRFKFEEKQDADRV